MLEREENVLYIVEKLQTARFETNGLVYFPIPANGLWSISRMDLPSGAKLAIVCFVSTHVGKSWRERELADGNISNDSLNTLS